MLYQRYFLRMNQTNMAHLIGLLLVVAVMLSSVEIKTLLIAQSFLADLLPFTDLKILDTEQKGYEWLFITSSYKNVTNIHFYNITNFNLPGFIIHCTKNY